MCLASALGSNDAFSALHAIPTPLSTTTLFYRPLPAVVRNWYVRVQSQESDYSTDDRGTMLTQSWECI